MFIEVTFFGENFYKNSLVSCTYSQATEAAVRRCSTSGLQLY